MDETLEGSKHVSSSSNPQRVSRRSIIRSGSEVRRGRIYEDQIDTTIRAVTPDSELSGYLDSITHEGIQLSPPASSNIYRKDSSAPASVIDDDSAAESKRRPSQRRTRTKEDLAVEASPSSLLNKTRKRLGSITTGAQIASKQDNGYGSIGYPSVGNASTAAAMTDASSVRPPGTPRRTVSSDAAVGLNTAASMQSPVFLNTDASKILNLMKTTCGRMHGILFFRTIGTTVWDSGYCAVNVAPGSLVCQKQGEVAAAKTLIPDLRGCTVRTNYDSESQSTYISVFLPQSGLGVQLRPPVPETFDSWLAALLCWQPLRPRGLHSKMTKPQTPGTGDRRPVSQRRMSDYNTTSKSAAIVKVGKMVFLEGPIPTGSQRNISRRGTDINSLQERGPWRRVSCTLHENGTFKLLTEGDAKTICMVRLSQLTRCAVQRLDESVLDAPFCLAIYPQYTIQNSFSRRSQPLVLGLESKAAYEAWFVLLRALTVPELYGPEQRSLNARDSTRSLETQEPVNMFRIERSLAVKVTEAKFEPARVAEFALGSQGNRARSFHGGPNEIDVYADVLFGRDLMARTATKTSSSSAFWVDEFFLPDIPSMLSTLTVIVKVGNPAEREWTMVAHHEYDLSNADPNNPGMNGLEIASHDPDFGKVEILVDDLEREKAVEKWWPLLDKSGHQVGQVLMKISLSETVVLMETEYQQLSKLLHTFDNSLTTQIGHALSLELKALSEILLDIFQATDCVKEWIEALIDEEIDGIYKETPPVRMRFSGRIHSNDSYESAEQRELLVRDLSRSATMEANLLFRGNSLVTKALDAHMKRLGKAYLEAVLGDKIRQIASRGSDCEVDPLKIQSRDQATKNWATLIGLTKSVWQSICTSASKCPVSMRLIFKHIRSCAEDRYGSFIRTVKYTSVSGFLFLRFFCPAILNPKLFGLIDHDPSDRARRTFILIAKALNVLANMSKFGTKEPWMEPMNKFLLSATPDFKRFIEEICSVSLTQPTDLEPQYQAPNQIRARLPPMSREGLPSLPFLLDAPRSYAALVDLWVDNAPDHFVDTGVEDSLHKFNQACLDLHRKGRESMASAEPAEKPDNNLEPQWQRILSERQKPKRSVSGNQIEQGFTGLSLDQEITALPQRGDSRKVQPGHKVDNHEQTTGGDTTPSSSTSATEQRHVLYALHPGLNPVTVGSTNSSTVSFDDDPRSKALPASRDGSSKARFLEFVNPNSRKRGKGGGDPGRVVKENERNEF